MVEDARVTDGQISTTLSLYGFSADPRVCCQIRAYIELLLRWNEKVSLTTIIEPAKILRLQFGESLFATKHLSVEKGRLADVGSGSGFPGIPLAMASPQIHATLIEPNQKKAAFLSEAVRSLKLPNAAILRSRIRDIDPKAVAFDFITARAVGGYQNLLQWCAQSLARSGRLVLWVGRENAEDLSRTSGWIWRQPIHIPESHSRFLLIGSLAAD
jgi:16S rRNA (guanine527-N7)-methyltransferase